MTKAKKQDKAQAKASYQPAGDVYLLVLDDTPEFDAALERVAFLTQQNGARVALLNVIEEDAFLHWKFIEKQIQTDQREAAEQKLWEVAHKLYDMAGVMSGFYIKEGKTRQEVMNVINTDETIRALVLGATKHSSNPLISYLTGKGISELKVPLVIVPEP